MRPVFYIIGGARPNFVKIAALAHAFKRYQTAHPNSHFDVDIVNTGQHYDYLMSTKLFQDLNIPKPYADLEVGSSSHADQTAKIMMRFEALLIKRPAHLVIVVGDVNSTLACSLVASKMGIQVAHVESGLRSFDRTMPEEINRKITDTISDYLFTTSPDANRNLIKEGISVNKIFLVGNVMVDTLFANLSKVKLSKIHETLKLHSPYALLTLHRPSNVDNLADFVEILKSIKFLQRQMPVLFPIHPRSEARLKSGKLQREIVSMENLKICPPAGYLDFIALLKSARLVLTDSGGVQEETTALGVPCLTLRDNTERPITIHRGTNILAGRKSGPIIRHIKTILRDNSGPKPAKPSFWDGRAADRIVRILTRRFRL